MAGNYRVKQGDHLCSIAKGFGFSEIDTIWNDPNNAQLKQQRGNPNVLAPGDQLYIPDRELRIEPCSTDLKHKFVAHKPALKLRLVLEDLYEKPIANASCDLVLDGQLIEITTDAAGRIEQPIGPDTKGGVVIVHDAQTPYQDDQIAFKIGYLDPVDQVSGQVGRLENLGYNPGDGTPGTADQFESAVEEFQCDNSLNVDGICGPDTQAKLKQIHGC
jgi:Putative peptidoglycan binding domain